MKKHRLIAFIFVGFFIHSACVLPGSSGDPGEGPGGSAELDLGVTHGYTEGVNYAEASQDGIKRVGEYISWRELEPREGQYSFSVLDETIQEVTKAGMRAHLLIEISDVSCTSPEKTDEECVGQKFPEDLSFSRNSSRFDDQKIVTRLSNLVIQIMGRYDPKVLTHLYVGNETDSYLRAVRWASEGSPSGAIDLFPGFLNLIRQIREKVGDLPGPRPQFGTSFTFYAFEDYYKYIGEISQQVEVMGITTYPTDPEWADRETATSPRDRLSRWFDAARGKLGDRPIAINEIGTPAAEPYGTPEDQAAFAQMVIDYLKGNPEAFEYAVWFSMYDNPPLDDTWSFFSKIGLQTVSGQKRPAYDVWASQGGQP